MFCLKNNTKKKRNQYFSKNCTAVAHYIFDLIAFFSYYISFRNFYWIPLLFIFIFVQETNQFRMFHKKTSIFRSSRSQKFFEIGVLKNFAIFTRKQMCQSLFLTKLQSLHQDYCWRNYIRKQPLKLILKNRCSDLCSRNPWKITIKKLIFQALLKINFFIYIFQGF